MKRKIWALSLTLAAVLGLAACGGQPDADPGGPQESSPDSLPGGSQDSALARWYASGSRTELEEQINSIYGAAGLSFSVTIEEPDTIVYNYQYLVPPDFGDASQEEIDAYFATSLKEEMAVFESDFAAYRDTYGIPLNTIRMVYRDVDGSLLFSEDITRNQISPAPSVPSAPGASGLNIASLQEWIDCGEMTLTADAVNEVLASYGVSVAFRADGSVLVMEFTYADSGTFSGMNREELDTFFSESVSPVLAPTAETLFETFRTEYGFELDDIRLTFCDENGALFYEKNLSEIRQ